MHGLCRPRVTQKNRGTLLRPPWAITSHTVQAQCADPEPRAGCLARQDWPGPVLTRGRVARETVDNAVSFPASPPGRLLRMLSGLRGHRSAGTFSCQRRRQLVATVNSITTLLYNLLGYEGKPAASFDTAAEGCAAASSSSTRCNDVIDTSSIDRSGSRVVRRWSQRPGASRRATRGWRL